MAVGWGGTSKLVAEGVEVWVRESELGVEAWKGKRWGVRGVEAESCEVVEARRWLFRVHV